MRTLLDFANVLATNWSVSKKMHKKSCNKGVQDKKLIKFCTK